MGFYKGAQCGLYRLWLSFDDSACGLKNIFLYRSTSVHYEVLKAEEL